MAEAKRRRRWPWIALAAIALIVVAAVLVLPRLLDVEQHRGRIEQALADATGWSAEVGEIDLSVLRGLRLSVASARLGSPDGASTIDVERVDVRAALGPLLRGRLAVRAVELVRPRIELVRTRVEDGWALPFPDAAEGAEEAGPVAVSVDSVAVSDGNLRLEDRTAEPPWSFALDELDLELRPEQGRIDGAANLADDAGRLEWSGGASDLRIRVDGLGSDLLRPWVGEGLIGPGGLIDGDVTVRWPEVTGRLTARDLRLLDGGQPLRQPEVTFRVVTDGGAWELRELELGAGDVSVSGSGSLLPELRLDLSMDETDLASALELLGSVASLPLDVQPPGTIDLELSLRPDAAGATTIRAEGSISAASFDPGGGLPAVLDLSTGFELSAGGALELSPLRGRVAGGPLEGKVNVDTLFPPGELLFEGVLSSAALGELLAGFVADADRRVQGRTGVRARVAVDLAREVVDASALRGNVELDASELDAPGWDLEGAIRAELEERLGGLAGLTSLLEGRGQASEDVADATMRLLDRMLGRVRLDTIPWALDGLELSAGGVSAAGGGTFDPLAGTISLELTATLDEEETRKLVGRHRQLKPLVDSRGRLQLPLAIEGPLTGPKIQVELGKLAEEGREKALGGLLRDLIDR